MRKLLFVILSGFYISAAQAESRSLPDFGQNHVSLFLPATAEKADTSYLLAKTYFLPDYQSSFFEEGVPVKKTCSSYGYIDAAVCKAPMTVDKLLTPEEGLQCGKKCVCPASFVYDDAKCAEQDFRYIAGPNKCNGLSDTCVGRTECPEGYVYGYGIDCGLGYTYDRIDLITSTGGGSKFCRGPCAPMACDSGTTTNTEGSCPAGDNSYWGETGLYSGDSPCRACMCDYTVYKYSVNSQCKSVNNGNANWVVDKSSKKCTNYMGNSYYSACTCTPTKTCEGYNLDTNSCTDGSIAQSCDNGCSIKYQCIRQQCTLPTVDYEEWCGTGLSCFAPLPSGGHCIEPPSCSDLGYTSDTSLCSGLPVIRCPYNTSYVFCYR